MIPASCPPRNAKTLNSLPSKGARPFAKRRPVVSIVEGRGRSSRGTPPPSTERRPHYAMKFCKY